MAIPHKMTLLAALALAAAACSGTAATTTAPPATTTTTVPPSTTVPPAITAPPPTTSTTFPLPTTTLPPRPFTIAAATPVVVPAPGQQFTNPGAIVREGRRWSMLRNSFTSFPGRSITHHLVSTDGMTWEERVDDPVFKSDDVPFGGGNAFLMSAYVDDDGTWVGYFYTWEGRFGNNVIGRATAAGPNGPWLADPAPVLTPGGRRAWDGASVIEPSVVRTEDGLLMYYAGIDATGVGAIGLATSDDGIAWTKHDDPSTTQDRFAESDPVLVGDGGWDGRSIGCPDVVAVDGGLLMTYDSSSPRRSGVGAARSDDGVTWRPVATNPQITTADTPGGERFFQSELVAGPEGVWFFLEVSANDGTVVYPYAVDLDLLG